MDLRESDYIMILRHLWFRACNHTSDAEKPVGCLIQDTKGDNHFGYNITVDGEPLLRDKSNILHAEQVAILEAGDGCLKGTLLVTKAPCLDCAIEIVEVGISKVIAPRIYPDSKWYSSQLKAIEYFKSCNISVIIVDFDDRLEMKQYKESKELIRELTNHLQGEFCEH